MSSSTLEEEIASLKQEIAEYRIDLKNAATLEDKRLLLEVIKASRDNLTELLKEKKHTGEAAILITKTAVPSSNIVLYCAKVELVGSKVVKGVRALVYQIASKFGGFYSQRREESIYYDGNNLIVNILFSSREKCSVFVNELDANLRYYPLLSQENIHISELFEEVYLNEEPKAILMRHYNTNESESEAYSVAITRVTHITSKTLIDFETELVMIENPALNDFVGLECYRCHLMSQAEFPEEKDNLNNILWMSWALHQRFDGLNTTEKHKVPQIAISFIEGSDVPELFEGGLERYRVSIAVECPNDDILAVMRERIKPGSTVVEEEKKIRTYVFVEDPKDFERCLTYKYNETKFIWTKKAFGTPVTEQEAHILRRSSRLEAKKRIIAKHVGSPRKNKK
jgi:hypothetical protein